MRIAAASAPTASPVATIGYSGVWCGDQNLIAGTDTRNQETAITWDTCSSRCTANAACNYFLWGVVMWGANVYPVINRCALFVSCDTRTAYADGDPDVYVTQRTPSPTTQAPTQSPTHLPTPSPTEIPTPSPSETPTTSVPTASPTATPTQLSITEALQNSFDTSGRYCRASNCIDGRTSGPSNGCNHCQCSTSTLCHSEGVATNPYLRLTLSDRHIVRYVKVFNRDDCAGCLDRLGYHQIYVGDDPNAYNANSLCATTTAASDQLLVQDVCTGESIGRYVFVVLPGTRLLNLNEVQVFGSSIPASGTLPCLPRFRSSCIARAHRCHSVCAPVRLE
jgi:hypothetical protein